MTTAPTELPDTTLTFRAAQHDDQAAIEKLTRDIWDGGDYLPRVWHEWVEKSGNLLQVGMLDGQIVVVGRVSQLAPGEWWMEGMRVHPQYQGRGLATRLHNHLLALALRQRPLRSLGLTTYIEEAKIIHLAEQSGMTPRGRYRYFRAAPREATVPGVVNARISPEELLGRLATSRWLAATDGYLMMGWVARELTPEWVAEIVAAKEVWACGDAIALISNEKTHDDTWLYLLYGKNQSEMSALIQQARHLASRHMTDKVLRCFAPAADEALHQLLSAAGLQDPEDGPFYLIHFARDIVEEA